MQNSVLVPLLGAVLFLAMYDMWVVLLKSLECRRGLCRIYAHFVANMRCFGFVLCRLLRRHLAFDSDFAQMSGPKIGGWNLWCNGYRLVFLLNLNLISKRFQLVFHWNSNGFQIYFHCYLNKVSTGFLMDFHLYSIEILTGFPIGFHWNLIEIYNLTPLKFQPDSQWISILKSFKFSIEFQLDFNWICIGIS